MTDTQTMHAIAIGPRELLSGLAAFGVNVRHAVNKDEVLEAVAEIRSRNTTVNRSISDDKKYAIIFITESIVKQMNDAEYTEVMGLPVRGRTQTGDDLPVVLTIPDLNSDPDAGLEKLASLTKRAVGVDIFSK